jgi:hypothetical protein
MSLNRSEVLAPDEFFDHATEFSEITRRNDLYQGEHRHNACYR